MNFANTVHTNLANANKLVPWPVVLLVLSAIVLFCSSCLTLLTDPVTSKDTAVPYREETMEPVVPDVTLPPRERETSYMEETVRPIDFYDSVVTRLKYN